MTTTVSEVDKYLTEPSQDVPKWEYAVLTFDFRAIGSGEIERQMDEMGSYGWDMQSSSLDRHSLVINPPPPLILTVIFKRQTAS